MPDPASLRAWVEAYGLLAEGGLLALSVALYVLVTLASKSPTAQGAKLRFAIAISAVAWTAILLVGLWFSEVGPDARAINSDRSVAFAVLVLSSEGFVATLLALYLLFFAGDWLRHRIMRT